MSRKKYSKELKALVALGAIKGQKTSAELASEYGVQPNQISNWQRQLLAAAPSAFIPNNETALPVLYDQVSSEQSRRLQPPDRLPERVFFNQAGAADPAFFYGVEPLYSLTAFSRLNTTAQADMIDQTGKLIPLAAGIQVPVRAFFQRRAGQPDDPPACSCETAAWAAVFRFFRKCIPSYLPPCGGCALIIRIQGYLIRR